MQMHVRKCEISIPRASSVEPSVITPSLRKLSEGRPVMVWCELRYSVPAGWILLGGTSFTKVEVGSVAAEEGSFGD